MTIPANVADTDNNGHGTHVAGIAAGSTYGIAKAANVIAVKVFNDAGFGSTSDVIAGLDWVSMQHRSGNATVSVVTLSLGGSVSPSLDAAVDAIIAAGVHVVTAAGSSSSDACNYSPGHNPNVINVFSTDAEDNMIPSANFGPCGTLLCTFELALMRILVTLGAPGHSITSLWIGDSLAEVRTLSGTVARQLLYVFSPCCRVVHVGAARCRNDCAVCVNGCYAFDAGGDEGPYRDVGHCWRAARCP